MDDDDDDDDGWVDGHPLMKGFEPVLPARERERDARKAFSDSLRQIRKNGTTQTHRHTLGRAIDGRFSGALATCRRSATSLRNDGKHRPDKPVHIMSPQRSHTDLHTHTRKQEIQLAPDSLVGINILPWQLCCVAGSLGRGGHNLRRGIT